MQKCKIRECLLWGKGIEVPFEKGRKQNPDLLWYGESPGAMEEIELRPFRGDAGDMLRECQEEAGITYGVDFYGNSARCRINKDKLTGKQISEILACCHENAVRPIRFLKPKAVIVMGDFALRQITKKSGISKHRGKWIWSEEFNCWIFPTFHPAYILRNRSLKRRLVKDFEMVKSFVDNKYQPVTLDEKEDVTYREVESIGRFLRKGTTIGFDTEAQGLDWLDPNFVLLSYQLSNEEGTGVCVNLHKESTEDDYDFTIAWPRKIKGKKFSKTEPQIVYVKRCPNFERKKDQLRQLLENPEIKKYMMNGNYDLHATDSFFRRIGETPPKTGGYVMDIQAGANVLDENVFKKPALDDLQTILTDMPPYPTPNREDMLSVPLQERVTYGCADADLTRRIGVVLKHDFANGNRKQGDYFIKFTMPALSFFRTLESNGALIDQERLPIVTDDVEKGMREFEKKALELVPRKLKSIHLKGKGLSLTRDDFISDILFGSNGFRLSGIRRTAGKGGWSVDKMTRIRLMDKSLSPRVREFLTLYEQFQEDHTLWSRYLKGFDRWIRSDRRIHTIMSLATTVTGRSASSKPNMQNNPKKSRQAQRVRELIIAPPGYKIIAGDEKQSELRWAGEMSQDPELIRIFRDHIDPHTETALELLRKREAGWTWEKWNALDDRRKSLERRKAKCVNFGLLFGMAAKGFVNYAKKDYGLDLTIPEAEKWIRIWFGKFTTVREYQRRMVDFGRTHGYVESVLGRRRRLPELRSRDGFVRGEAERMAINHPIQSPSSDMVVMAGMEIQNKYKPDPKEFRPILFVHDELVWEVREDAVDKWVPIIKEEMEHPPFERDFGFRMRIPLEAEIKVGDSLANLKEV